MWHYALAPMGTAPIHEQLAMRTDGTWDAHVADVEGDASLAVIRAVLVTVMFRKAY